MIEDNHLKYLSEDFLKKLFQFSAGYISPESFEKLIKLIESEISRKYFTFSSESNLLRIITGMFDKISFLNDCIKYPHYIEILCSISANSNYLTDILVRNPELFYLIINPSRLKEKISTETFSDNIKNITSAYKSFDSKVNSLRTAKRKEILRIGVDDILGNSDLPEVTAQLSTLARGITSELFSICYEEIKSKYDIQLIKNQYAITALGKLGGRELNYSSDIDLIIFYDKNNEAGKGKLYSEILIETIKLFIETSTAVTSSGYIYRVDFRLRPDGRNALLTRSINEYLSYYESRGEDWERQMLIKADFVGGDFPLFEKFKNSIQPFIYPSSFLVPPSEQIKRLKINIEKNLTDEANIKLISGGIRDIEFSVQALQLLYGGKNIQLRKTNTLSAINSLETHKFLSKKESEIFKHSYLFYRKIEHYLQLMNDAQTHSIPAEGEIAEKLARFLGFKNFKQFRTKVLEKRNAVKKIYNSIVGADKSDSEISSPMSRIKFENKKNAEKDLLFLREGKGLLGEKEFDKKSIHRFQKIEPVLFDYLESSTVPDIILKNFVRIIRNATFASIWYEEFKDKKFFISFLRICEVSQKSVDLFAEDKVLREMFLTRKVFEKILKNNLAKLSTKQIVFTLAVQFTAGLITREKISATLSRYFFEKINLSAEKFFARKDINSPFFIAAMGSYSTNEMSFASDIDLIFVVKDLNNIPEAQKHFQNYLLKIKNDFKPFDVDCRLRPEGKSSLLVWDLESYNTYLLNRTRIWELQSLTKINLVHGDKIIFNEFIAAIKKRIEKETPENLKNEIAEMRKKLSSQGVSSISNIFNIKKSRGGIADIEFLLQYLILLNPGDFKKMQGKEIPKVVKFLSSLPNNSEINILSNNFAILKKYEMINQNIFNTSLPSLPQDEKKLFLIAREAGYNSVKELQTHLSEIIKTNSALFNKYLEV
jgi:[glutamine synthetase] adenylyltransferase / [glutamine synthetase]-adenylyl-L-tyrosine phosphorylase